MDQENKMADNIKKARKYEFLCKSNEAFWEDLRRKS
jgi:hypothetical protein